MKLIYKTLIPLIIIFCGNYIYACTAFGIITKSGTIIGKNRDYYYDNQQFQLIMPLKQFRNWYDNSYNHLNKFYGITSNNDIKMGVNQYGLTAIEEDPIYPLNALQHRKYLQPINGNSEGMILYGILQNFKTVDEILPFIPKIFEMAAPNFYQFADNKKILVVEVSFGENDTDEKRKYKYQTYSSQGEIFAHTNTYLFKEFYNLNKIQDMSIIEKGCNYRLQKMYKNIKDFSQNPNINFNWFIDTTSNLINPADKNWCQNTSIFRSDLHGIKQITKNIPNDKVYGTVSSLIVLNNNKLENSIIRLTMVNSLNTLNNGNQLIDYQELFIPLLDLFSNKDKIFVKKSFIRNAPENGICS